jgi:hypothetical protein
MCLKYRIIILNQLLLQYFASYSEGHPWSLRKSLKQLSCFSALTELNLCAPLAVELSVNPTLVDEILEDLASLAGWQQFCPSLERVVYFGKVIVRLATLRIIPLSQWCAEIH